MFRSENRIVHVSYLFTGDLMLEAAPYSSTNFFDTRLICPPAGIMIEIKDVPFPWAVCNLLRSFLNCHMAISLSGEKFCAILKVDRSNRQLKKKTKLPH